MSVATPRTLGGEVRVALEAELVSHTAAGFRFVPRPITGVVEDDGAGVAWGRRSGGRGGDGGEGTRLLVRGGRRRRLRRRVLHDRREAGAPAVPAPAPVAGARARALSIIPSARRPSAPVPSAVIVSTAAVAAATAASAAAARTATNAAATAATAAATATTPAAAAAAAAAAAEARVGRGGGKRASPGEGREGTRMVRREAKAAEVRVEKVVTGLVVRGRLPPSGCEAIGDPGGLGEVAALGDG